MYMLDGGAVRIAALSVRDHAQLATRRRRSDRRTVGTGNTINMMSLIGMIMLTGLVGKNAILLVDYTNTLRREGRARERRASRGGTDSIAADPDDDGVDGAAMLPSALKLGEGAELRAPMAVVVIGGLLTSTLLTLGVHSGRLHDCGRRPERGQAPTRPWPDDWPRRFAT